VLGYAHGGVGELLAELYPHGSVPLGNATALLKRAIELLRAPPPVVPLEKYRLADMQTATLALYDQVVTQNTNPLSPNDEVVGDDGRGEGGS